MNKDDLKRKEVKRFLDKYGNGLFIEVENKAQPTRFLKVLTTNGSIQLGTLKKDVFKWFPNTAKMDEQPPCGSVTWYKFLNLKPNVYASRKNSLPKISDN